MALVGSSFVSESRLVHGSQLATLKTKSLHVPVTEFRKEVHFLKKYKYTQKFVNT